MTNGVDVFYISTSNAKIIVNAAGSAISCYRETLKATRVVKELKALLVQKAVEIYRMPLFAGGEFRLGPVEMCSKLKWLRN